MLRLPEACRESLGPSASVICDKIALLQIFSRSSHILKSEPIAGNTTPPPTPLANVNPQVTRTLCRPQFGPEETPPLNPQQYLNMLTTVMPKDEFDMAKV